MESPATQKQGHNEVHGLKWTKLWIGIWLLACCTPILCLAQQEPDYYIRKDSAKVGVPATASPANSSISSQQTPVSGQVNDSIRSGKRGFNLHLANSWGWSELVPNFETQNATYPVGLGFRSELTMEVQLFDDFWLAFGAAYSSKNTRIALSDSLRQQDFIQDWKHLSFPVKFTTQGRTLNKFYYQASFGLSYDILLGMELYDTRNPNMRVSGNESVSSFDVSYNFGFSVGYEIGDKLFLGLQLDASRGFVNQNNKLLVARSTVIGGQSQELQFFHRNVGLGLSLRKVINP